MSRLFVEASDMKASGSQPVAALPFSLSCWFKVASDPGAGNQWPILGLFGAASDIWLAAYYSGTQRLVRVYYNTSWRGSSNNLTQQWVIGQWHHVLLTVADANARVIYLDNGNYDNQTGGVALDSTGTLDVGYSADGNANFQYFDGAVAEVAVWNVSLSAAEAAILSKGYAAPFVRPSALQFYAPLWGRHSPEPDLRKGNALTLTNSPTAATHSPVRGLRRLGRFDDSSIAMLMGHYLAYSGGTLL